MRRLLITVGLALLVMLITPLAASAGTGYLVNMFGPGPTLTPFDTQTQVVGTPTILPPGTTPREIAITPDGRSAYVADSGSSGRRGRPGSVTVVDIQSGVVTASVAMPPSLSGSVAVNGIAITPDGTTAYVTAVDGVSGIGYLVGINTATNTAQTPIPLGVYGAGAIAITPDGSAAYAADGNTQVVPVDLSAGVAGAPVTLPGNTFTYSLAVDPDGSTVYAARSALELQTIDVATNTAGPSIALPNVPVDLAVSADGDSAYATAPNGGNTLVVPIDLVAKTAGAPFNTTPRQPFDIAITPDGSEVFVTTSGSATLPIETATGTIGTPILQDANAIVVAPDQPPAAAFSATSAGANTPTSFDASASSDADGTVASYEWNFGDGHTATTASPATTHAFSAAGSYNVTLKVTDNEGCSTQQTFTGRTVSCNGSGVASASHSISISVPTAVTPAKAKVTLSGLKANRRCVDVASIVKPKRGDKGLSFSFKLSESAVVEYAMLRRTNGPHWRSCPRPSGTNKLTFGAFSTTKLNGVKGQQSTVLGKTSAHSAAMSKAAATLRVGRKLPPGTYLLKVKAKTSDGRVSKTATVKFWVYASGS